MTNLTDIISSMVKDVKAGKFKEKKKPSIITGKVDRQEGVGTPSNTWTDEALVLVMYELHCDGCGNESTGWEPGIFVERHNRRRKLPITLIERLGKCHYSSVYGSLPKRIDVIHRTTSVCPQCFGLDDSNHGELISTIHPQQLNLHFEAPDE